jgi:hypothetical protein
VHQSAAAQEYLKELGEETMIHVEARQPAFVATATMSEWLQHPHELDGVPLSLEVYDTREIYWPPLKERKRMWLFRFTYKFPGKPETKTGFGLVGGMTWSSFKEYDTPPKAEALYIHHCALELSRGQKGAPKEVTDEEARAALDKGNPGMFPK